MIGRCFSTLRLPGSLGSDRIMPCDQLSWNVPCSLISLTCCSMRGQNSPGYIWYRRAGIPSSPGEDCGSSRSSAVRTVSSVGSCHRLGSVVPHRSGGSQPWMYAWHSLSPLLGDCMTDCQCLLRACPMFLAPVQSLPSWSLTAAICFLVTSCFSSFAAILRLASLVAGSYSLSSFSCSFAIASTSVRCWALLLFSIRWESCWYASTADLESIPSSASSSFALALSLNMLQSLRASSIPLIPEFHFFCARFTSRDTLCAPSITACHHCSPCRCELSANTCLMPSWNCGPLMMSG